MPLYLQHGTQFHKIVFRFENLKLKNSKIIIIIIIIVEGHILGSKWKEESPTTRAAKGWQTSGKTIRPKQ